MSRCALNLNRTEAVLHSSYTQLRRNLNFLTSFFYLYNLETKFTYCNLTKIHRVSYDLKIPSFAVISSPSNIKLDQTTLKTNFPKIGIAVQYKAQKRKLHQPVRTVDGEI